MNCETFSLASNFVYFQQSIVGVKCVDSKMTHHIFETKTIFYDIQVCGFAVSKGLMKNSLLYLNSSTSC